MELDISLFYPTQPKMSAVQDILAYLPSLAKWPQHVKILKTHVRQCRRHVLADSLMVLYNLTVWANWKGDEKEYHVDVLWKAHNNITLLYISEEKQSWLTPEPFDRDALNLGSIWL